jgi:hypothetical protein
MLIETSFVIRREMWLGHISTAHGLPAGRKVFFDRRKSRYRADGEGEPDRRGFARAGMARADVDFVTPDR